MIQIILISISIIIIVYLIFSSKKNSNKNFNDVINAIYVASESLIIMEEKKIDFIQNLRNKNFEDKYINKNQNIYEYKECQYSVENTNEKERIKNIYNTKINSVEKFLEKGYNEIEICRELSIGKGEYLLILNFLNMKKK